MLRLTATSVITPDVVGGFETGRARANTQDLGGRGLLLQRLTEMLSCLGKFAGPLIQLFLEVGGGGTAMPRNR